MTTQVRPIHPFPARMAPEIALSACDQLPTGSLVLDPMAGSGTVLRVSSSLGHRAVGFDIDPLSVLMARVWVGDVDESRVEALLQIVSLAARSTRDRLAISWIDEDPETSRFVDYWFAAAQQTPLRAIASWLKDLTGPEADLLRLGLSRIVITKDRGASLARDTAHSRPHKWYEPTDYDVVANFERSVRRLLSLVRGNSRVPRQPTVELGDARRLPLAGESVDLVVTSPPYLNAIDYLRGHRLSLIWLGYRVADLRLKRSSAMGTERGLHVYDHGASSVMSTYSRSADLSGRNQAILYRYAGDLVQVAGEIRRVLRPEGRAVIVIGNSFIQGIAVDNAKAVVRAAFLTGMTLDATRERILPDQHRYLPPPGSNGSLNKRMRTETVLEFRRVA